VRITVHYFAMLREQRGLDEESIERTSPSLRELYRDLREAYTFTVSDEHVRPAVNDAFCDWDRPLRDGDRVVFIPPVAGG
jgi:molybdopterin synthase sulfur carrier subunit